MGLEFLMDDPRPELPDTQLWQQLFRNMKAISDIEKRYLLHKRLWSLRSSGLMIKPGDRGLKFDLGPVNDWDREHFEQIKNDYLKPYAAELSSLLRRLEVRDERKVL